MVTNFYIGSKYQTLAEFLSARAEDRWTASFDQVEQVLGFELPESARRHRPWWANQNKMNHSQTKGWMAAGWLVDDISLEQERVTFVRRSRMPTIAGPAECAPFPQKGLSIAEAKAALSIFYDTPAENIDITIRG
jgi:hypothetical protein